MEETENKVTSVEKPQKKNFRQRAHANPFSDHNLVYPTSPDRMDWSVHYPETKVPVTFLDVGCGYGGLLISLSDLYPDKVTLGMEIRVKVTNYVNQRIEHLRSTTGKYSNISVIRTNSMKFLPNFFVKGQLEKMFFLFPDPHFKKKKHKARIITDGLLAEYAYLLSIGGLLYIATDVSDLYDWMVLCLEKHPLFEKETRSDPLENVILQSTEEGIKVKRNNGDKFFAIYRRIEE